MTEFDLSVLNTLNDKFILLENELQEKRASVEEKESQISQLDTNISSLESQKLSISVELGAIKNELIKLDSLYEEKKKQYKDIQENATKILKLFN